MACRRKLGLTPAEAHDNRLCLELLTRLQPVELLFYVVAGHRMGTAGDADHQLDGAAGRLGQFNQGAYS